MKIIVVGDTHGRQNWKQIAEKENDFDKFIFIGDYFDTHDNVSAAEQIANFKDILQFKRDNKDKVILLVGNHDFHYMRGISENYSGYQELHAIDIQEIIHEALNDNLLQMCYIEKNIIFSHAGISKTWARTVLGRDTFNLTAGTPLQIAVNDMFKYQPQVFCFTPGEMCDMYGNDVEQTPIWIRPQALAKDMLDNFTQVVGHTQVPQITMATDRLLLIDTLGISGEYVVINDNELGFGKV